MPSNRCADRFGISNEMIKYSNFRFHCILRSLINSLIDKDTVDNNWKQIILSMIPKQGDLSRPNNWRLIAILFTFYNICSRMLYNRLLHQLDSCQHFDQCGIRPGVRIEDALVVVETLISKTLEWNVPL